MRDGPRGFGQDSSCPGLLRCRLCHTSASAYGAFTRCGRPFQSVRLASVCAFADGPTTPADAWTSPVWAGARSLATTCAIVGLLSFPPGTEMFQFPGFAPALQVPESLPAGCPIRRSTDQGIFAPPRGLSQLVTSFVASESQGILHVPLSPFSMTLAMPCLIAWHPFLILIVSGVLEHPCGLPAVSSQPCLPSWTAFWNPPARSPLRVLLACVDSILDLDFSLCLFDLPAPGVLRPGAQLSNMSMSSLSL